MKFIVFHLEGIEHCFQQPHLECDLEVNSLADLNSCDQLRFCSMMEAKEKIHLFEEQIYQIVS